MKRKILSLFILVFLVGVSLNLTACYENDNYYEDDWDDESYVEWDDEDYADEDWGDEEYANEDLDDEEDSNEDGNSGILSGFFYDEPEDCYEDEYYDEESQLCLPSDEEYVSSWLDENEDTLFDEEDTYWDDNNSEDGSEQVLVTYSISADQLSLLSEENVSGSAEVNYQNDTNTHEQMWQLFAAIIPQNERTEISRFVIFTDGTEETLAWMEPINDDLGNWSLAVDPADSSDKDELITTFVHEYGHLLTLNSEQIIGGASTCNVYMPDEGCSRDNSYLNQFVNEFWPYDLYNEWDEIQYEEDDDTYYDMLDAFYAKYQDQFVTDYAATNPEEDIAESWTYFVLQPKPDGNTIAEQKVLFFYDFPELVELRNEIASRVVSRSRRN